jgi:hypothetical protein
MLLKIGRLLQMSSPFVIFSSFFQCLFLSIVLVYIFLPPSTVFHRYDAYVDKERLYQVEDPSIPSVLRRPARAVWGLLAPHFRNEVSRCLGFTCSALSKRSEKVAVGYVLRRFETR